MNKINKISHLFQFDDAKIGQKHEYVQIITQNSSFFLVFNHFRPLFVISSLRFALFVSHQPSRPHRSSIETGKVVYDPVAHR